MRRWVLAFMAISVCCWAMQIVRPPAPSGVDERGSEQMTGGLGDGGSAHRLQDRTKPGLPPRLLVTILVKPQQVESLLDESRVRNPYRDNTKTASRLLQCSSDSGAVTQVLRQAKHSGAAATSTACYKPT